MRPLCQNCSAPLAKGRSDWSCPNGHGRILRTDQARDLWHSQLPRATRFEGLAGLWYASDIQFGEIQAWTGYSAQWLKRDVQLERRLTEAMGLGERS